MLVFLGVGAEKAFGGETIIAKTEFVPETEVWAGADATSDVWLIYSGITVAPWGKGIFGDGWRLRATGGYGQYDLSKTELAPQPDPHCDEAGHPQCLSANQRGRIQRKYKVAHSYTDALIGYQTQFGDLTAKGFLGFSYIDHAILAAPGTSRIQGAEYGVKGMVELWLNIGPKGWSSLDLSYSTAHQTGAARWRAGWRVVPDVSIGPEIRYDRTAADDAGRAGLFARYEWPGGEVSLAGGAAGTISGSDVQEIGGYATLNVLFQY